MPTAAETRATEGRLAHRSIAEREYDTELILARLPLNDPARVPYSKAVRNALRAFDAAK